MGKRNYFSLQSKTLISSALLLLLVASPLFFYHMFVVAPEGKGFKEETLSSQLNVNANQINSISQEGIGIAINLARQGELYNRLTRSQTTPVNGQQDWEKFIGSELARHVESFPNVVGAGIFYEPFAFATDQKYQGFHAQWVPPIGTSRKVEYSMSRSNPQLDYQNQDWYRTLIPSGWNGKRHLYKDVAWTGPYRDPVSLVPIISVLTAMYSENSELIGLASVDWNIDYLTETINRSRPTPNSIATLLYPATKSFAAVAGLEGTNLEPTQQNSWIQFIMLNPPTDRFEMVPAVNDNGDRTRVYSRMLTNGLVYSVIVPERDIVAQVNDMNNNFLYVLGALFFVALATHWFLARKYFKRLPELVAIASEYAAGDFSRTIDWRTGDEFQDLIKTLEQSKEYVQGIGSVAARLAAGEFVDHAISIDAPDQVSQSMRMLCDSLGRFSDEINLVEQRVQSGETDFRFDSTQFPGRWNHAGKMLNFLLNAMEEPIRETVTVCQSFESGNMPRLMIGERSGMFEAHREALEAFVQKYEADLRKLRLENEYLSVSKNEAMESKKIKSRMLTSACNEYQLYLKRISTLFASISELELPEITKNAIAQSRKECSQLLAISDDIIGYSELEEGLIKLENKPFNLYRSMFNIKDILQVHATRRRQQLRLVVEEDVPENLIGDSRVLEGVISHIVMQSIRRTDEEGTIYVKIAKRTDIDDTCTLVFNVIDSGGSALISRAFAETFSNVENDRDASLSSSEGGMGVLISEKLIQLMGGSFTIESRPTVGVQYQFTVPFVIGDRKALPMPEGMSSENTNQGVIHDPSRRVLLVEDNTVNQKLVARLLEHEGYQVTISGNGEEALAVSDENFFALILMDLSLPLVNGIEVTRRIRIGTGPCKVVPIVALTAHSAEHTMEECQRGGMNGYLLKPLDRKALINVLRTFAPIAGAPAPTDDENNAKGKDNTVH